MSELPEGIDTQAISDAILASMAGTFDLGPVIMPMHTAANLLGRAGGTRASLRRMLGDIWHDASMRSKVRALRALAEGRKAA